MSNVLIYDLNSGAALQYLHSVRTPLYKDEPNTIINPALPDAPLKYIKVVDGTALEMSLSEKAAVDLALEPAYTEKRANEYPTYGDQLDMIFHAMDSGEIAKATEWFNTIQAIKDKYPKPKEVL